MGWIESIWQRPACAAGHLRRPQTHRNGLHGMYICWPGRVVMATSPRDTESGLWLYVEYLAYLGRMQRLRPSFLVMDLTGFSGSACGR